MEYNPYLVFQRVFRTPQELQDLLNEQFNKGYETLSIWQGPGEYLNVVFVAKAVVANRNAAAGAFSTS